MYIKINIFGKIVGDVKIKGLVDFMNLECLIINLKV